MRRSLSADRAVANRGQHLVVADSDLTGFGIYERWLPDGDPPVARLILGTDLDERPAR
jgi:hypothetical protein